MDTKPANSDRTAMLDAASIEARTVAVISKSQMLIKMMRKQFTRVPGLTILAFDTLPDRSLLPEAGYTLLIEESYFTEDETTCLQALQEATHSAVVCGPLVLTHLPLEVNRISVTAIEQTEPHKLPALLEALSLKGVRLGIENPGPITETVQRFFELPLMGMVRIDTEGLICEANETFARLLDSTVATVVNTEFLSCVHPKSTAVVRGTLRALTANECGTTQLEMRCKLKDAPSRYCIACLSPVKSASGGIDSILVALLDITDRRTAEKKLRRKEMYLRQVIDILPHLVFAKDREGRFTLCNQAVANFFGTDIKQIIGKRDRDLNPYPVETERFQKEDIRVLRDGTPIVIPEEPLHHLSSDSIRWYQTIKKPIRNEQGIPVEVLGVATDLTERRRAEHALRSIVSGTASKTAEEFFRSLVRHLAEVLDTRYAFVAEVDPTSDTARTLAFWEGDNYGANVTYKLEGGPTKDIFDNELKLFEKNVINTFKNDIYLIENSIESYMGAPIFNSAGAPLGVLAVMDTKPMSEWLPAQSILRIFAERAGAELERIANETETQELHRQLLQSQKMDAIGKLAAGIAHDLNNALGAVVGHLQLIKGDRTLQPDIGTSVDVALSGCERASSLIEHLLGFSRQGKYNIESLSLSRVVNETIRFLGRVLAKDISIQVETPGSPIHIQADHAQIQQALTNLILNASQAMPDGGTITITLQTEKVTRPKRFNAKATPGMYARIDVADTGVGIPPMDQEKVFEPFYTTKKDTRGTGLGLSMVYGTLQNHGGWVSLKSAINIGSTFSLFIPVTDEERSMKEATPKKSSEEPKDGLIMVLDDEEYLVELALTFLERSGLRGQGFTIPREALNWYRENHQHVDLTILDMKMPDLNGAEVYDLMRSINPDTKVVILSGYIQDEAAQAVLDKGALRFFQKPLKYPELMEWIASFLAKRASVTA